MLLFGIEKGRRRTNGSASTGVSDVEWIEAEDSQKLPERNLLAAILERALVDCAGTAKDIPQHIKREARAWVGAKSMEAWSFNWVCEGLDLEPKTIRNFIKKHTERNCQKEKDEVESRKDKEIPHGLRIRRRRVVKTT